MSCLVKENCGFFAYQVLLSAADSRTRLVASYFFLSVETFFCTVKTFVLHKESSHNLV